MLFVAVSKLDVGMWERVLGFRKFLQPNNGIRGRRGGPGVVVYELASYSVKRVKIYVALPWMECYPLLEFSIIEDALLVAFNDDLKSSIDELLGRRWCQCRPPLKLFLFAAKPK